MCCATRPVSDRASTRATPICNSCCISGPSARSLYVDTSGEPLFKRGWRQDKGDAPLKETLAAAMLAAAGWRGTPDAGGALHDPCCGSGTIAIEAAQIACGIAPGLQRHFAFERLLPFGAAETGAHWQRMKDEATARVHASAVPIFASDVSFRMVDFARRNAERAGVAQAITFNGGDALERPAPALAPGLPGTLMLNPPYGERIEVLGKAASHGRAQRAAIGRGPQHAAGLLPPARRALEARLHRPDAGLDRLGAEPRHEAARRDAPGRVAPHADVERADRVPAVSLRSRRGVDALLILRCTIPAP